MDITDLPPQPSGFPKQPKETAIQKLQEDLDRQIGPFKEIQKFQDQLWSSRQLDQLQQYLKRHSPAQQLYDLMKPLGSERLKRDLLEANNPIKHLQGLVPKFGLSAFGLDSDAVRMAVGQGQIRDFAAKMAEVHLPKPPAYEKLVEQMQRQALGGLSIQELTRQIERTSPAVSAIESAMRSFDSMAGLFRDTDSSAYTQASLEEFEEQVEIISQTAVVEDDLQRTVEQIATAVSAHPNPTVRFLLWLHFRTLFGYIVSGIISTAISVAVTTYMASQEAPKSLQDASKGVKEAGRSAVAAVAMLKEHRFVSCDVLTVRMNPKARSPELGRLKFGSVVRVLKTEKDFAFVVWSNNESGAEIQGWVFARYLSKFN